MQSIETLRGEYFAMEQRLADLGRAICERQDYAAGYRDRKAGYYDKWYRRNRKDEGAAYDRGVVACVNAGDVSPDESFFLIECSA